MDIAVGGGRCSSGSEAAFETGPRLVKQLASNWNLPYVAVHGDMFSCLPHTDLKDLKEHILEPFWKRLLVLCQHNAFENSVFDASLISETNKLRC